MLLLDLVCHSLLTWFLLGWTGVIARASERAVLAVALALPVKSLEVFGALALGLHLEVLDQFLAGWFGMALAGWLFLTRPPHPVPPHGPVDRRAAPWPFWVLLTVLLAAALVLAGAIPITESDGIWYHLRGLTFFHDSDLASESIHPQYRAYPPFLPLLYAWMLSAGATFLTWIFPLFYLLLLLLVLVRMRAAGASPRLAAWLTAILAATPYFWWHALQPVLNLAAGLYFSLGVLYAYPLFEELVQDRRPLQPQPACGWAAISGAGLGAAAWTRPEFLLYGGLVWIGVVYLLTRREFAEQHARNRIFWTFTAFFLALPTLWAVHLGLAGGEIPDSSRAMSGAVGLMWLLAGLIGLGAAPRGGRAWGGLGVLVAVLFLAALWSGSRTGLSPLRAVQMGLFRSIGFHAFLSFLWLPALLFLAEPWRRWTRPMKCLLVLLAAYGALHFMLYTLLPLKSTSVAQYFESFRIPLGDAVNSPDTRELLAFYPALLFLLSRLKILRRALP